MRIIGLFLAVVLITPITSFAEENLFTERQYVLGVHNPDFYDDLESDCYWAEPHMPVAIVGGFVAELRGIKTMKQGGGIEKEGRTVGEVWACIGEVTERDNPALGLRPERAVAFYVDLDGEVFGGLGTWSPFTEADFPESGMAVWGGGAILVHLENDLPAGTAGAMTYNILDNYFSISGYDMTFDSMVISIRLLDERNFDREAAVKALKEIL